MAKSKTASQNRAYAESLVTTIEKSTGVATAVMATITYKAALEFTYQDSSDFVSSWFLRINSSAPSEGSSASLVGEKGDARSKGDSGGHPTGEAATVVASKLGDYGINPRDFSATALAKRLEGLSSKGGGFRIEIYNRKFKFADRSTRSHTRHAAVYHENHPSFDVEEGIAMRQKQWGKAKLSAMVTKIMLKF